MTKQGDLLRGRRVLVGGATGFLGTHLCRRLVADGAEVHAVSRTQREERPGSGIYWWVGDWAEAPHVDDLVGRVKPDLVFHLGGMVTAAPDVELVAPTFHSLLASTVNILTAVTRAGIDRVVLAGSLEEPTGETADMLVPSSPYAAAKVSAGAYARMFSKLYETPVVTVRPYMTYGPGQRATKIVPHTILSLLRHEAPRLSSGERALDWIYVDDVVDGFVRAASHPRVEGLTLDLGSGRAVPIRSLVRRLVRLVDPSIRPRYGAEPDRPHGPVRLADVDATAAAIGWRPRTPLSRGLATTVEWFRRRSSVGCPS